MEISEFFVVCLNTYQDFRNGEAPLEPENVQVQHFPDENQHLLNASLWVYVCHYDAKSYFQETHPTHLCSSNINTRQLFQIRFG